MFDRYRLIASCLLAVALAGCESADKSPSAPPSAEAPAVAQEPQVGEPEPTVTEVVMLEDDEDEPPHDGAWLYERNCAGCHNTNGDGQGPTMQQLKLKARDFKRGGFAFGNTREAIYRTITAGMPGSDVMPSFKVSLTEEERWLIAEHVLTLCPAPEERAQNTRLVVALEPQIARGLLPPIAEGKPRWPRGLLLGTPEGLTFEYRVDDVRLLAVRQGEFADRTDWNDRGGGELVPLGKAFYVPGAGDPPPTFALLQSGQERELAARLETTLAKRAELGLDYELVDKRGERQAWVSERLRVEALSIGGAFTRRFGFRGGAQAANVLVDLARNGSEGAWVRGEPSGWQAVGQLMRGPLPEDGWLVARRGDSFELVHVRADKNVKLLRDSTGLRFFVPVFAGGDQEVELAVTFVLAAEWNEELLAKLGRELQR
ncbi:MAG: c-type cytochrome [Planctomycetes bacterium]|nr:c-type cytochrome [Planctomycetota bacterium]